MGGQEQSMLPEKSHWGLRHVDACGRLQWAKMAPLVFFTLLEGKPSEKQRNTASKRDSLPLHGHRLDSLLEWAVHAFYRAVLY